MSKSHAVGIDLGTTYSAVARIDETGRTVMVRNGQGDILTPSVVLFDDQEIIVGKEAKKAAAAEPDRVAEYVKRDMGATHFSRPIRGEYLPPEVIQSCILRKLKDDIVAVLGPGIKAVITVPAYFDEPRRKATADAGEMAGLEVLDIVNEPTAAALAFGEHLGYLDAIGSPRETLRVLVYDLGGGTFDVTVVELRPGDLRTLATDGDVHLGGHDWDARVADYIAEQFELKTMRDPRTDAATATRLLRVVEEAKHTLSAREQATVHLEFAGQSQDIPLSRAKLEELTEDLLERTAYTTRQVLASSGLAWSDLSHVLLVGGSTRMPMVERMLEKLSGRKPQRQVHPDEAVARGAAIFAGYKLVARDERMPGPKFEVTDVNSHSLGIEGIDQRTGRKENVVLIPRNTPLPSRVTEKFVTKQPGQQSVVVQVLEGESKLPEQCTRIARAVLRQLPPQLPQGTKIEVTYEYATNGRLSVRAKMAAVSQELKIELVREEGLSDAHLARWKRLITGDEGFAAFGPALRELPRPNAGGAPLVASPSAAGAVAPGPIAARPVAVVPTTPVTQSAPKPLTLRPIPMSVPRPAGAAPAALATVAESAAAPSAAETTFEMEHSPEAAEEASPLVVRRAAPEDPLRKRARARRRMVINLFGHVMAAGLGLVIGYYILCIISPESNFLQLELPFLPGKPASSEPATGGSANKGPAGSGPAGSAPAGTGPAASTP